MLTRIIYPLSLRERISWRVKKLFPNVHDKNISLHFNKKLKLDLSKTDFGHQSIIFNGFYELGLSKAIVKLAEKGGLLVDVGANYGYFSCLWASQKPENRVIAFEASPVNVPALTNNVSKNNLSQTVRINPVAVGKEKGKLRFDLANESNQTGWGGLSLNNNSNSIEVDVVTLDNYAAENNIAKIDVLKIDTEGADTWVLYGAEKLLKEKSIAHIFFEHNLPRMKLLNISPEESGNFLKKYGYTVQKEAPNEFYAYPKS